MKTILWASLKTQKYSAHFANSLRALRSYSSKIMFLEMPLFFFLIFFLTVTPFLVSQELDCTVTINADNIQSAQRDYLRNFSSDIERYMNNTQFTSEDLDDEKIPCNLEIFVKTATTDNRYTAQVVIASQRPIYIGDEKQGRATSVIRILDNNWEFNYMPNQRMNHDEMMFDPFTGFLDFYAYLIIGFDLETYLPMSGTSCFQKASNTVQIASNSSVGGADWKASSAGYSKYGIADELSNMKYSSFRAAFNNYYFEGLDSLGINSTRALKNMLKSIESIYNMSRQNPRSVIIKQFFDAKFREIAEAFQEYPDRNIYDVLSTYDQEHRSIYQDAKIRKQGYPLDPNNPKY